MSHSTNIILRLVAATLGAYGASVVFSLAIVPVFVFALSSQLSDAVYAATMWSYVVFFLVFIASFAVASVTRLYFYLFIFSGCCFGTFLLANAWNPLATSI